MQRLLTKKTWRKTKTMRTIMVRSEPVGRGRGEVGIGADQKAHVRQNKVKTLATRIRKKTKNYAYHHGGERAPGTREG